MNNKTLIFMLITVTFTLSACGESAIMDSTDAFAPTTLGVAEVAGEAAPFIDSDEEGRRLTITQFQDRLIVRSGRLSIIVEDTEEMMRMIVLMAEAKGG